MKYHFFIKRRLRFFAVIILCVSIMGYTRGYSQEVTAEKVRAQYILKLKSFIRVGGRPVKKICYYEKAGVPEDESTGQLAAKYAKGVTVKSYRSIGDFSGCDIFYIPASEDANISEILANLSNSETLTISAAKRFIYRGGMIGFVIDDQDRVKMEVNLKNAKQKNISIRAEVLELMINVVN